MKLTASLVFAFLFLIAVSFPQSAKTTDGREIISAVKIIGKYDPAALKIPVVKGPVIWNDPSKPLEARVHDLIRRLSLAEKASQLMADAAALPRLGIPAYSYRNEGIHGYKAKFGVSTIFPQVIGMAATWDPVLIRKEADVIATEARAHFNNYTKMHNDNSVLHEGISLYAPNINIDRDPRWGRSQETYGEDPFLTGKMSTAFIKGLQGNNPKYIKAMSCAKHFTAYSGPEPQRIEFNSVPPKRDLYDTYLPAFETAVKQGHVGGIMGAYTSLYGVPDCANKFLLTNMLRKKWGFKGYVVSDGGAVANIWMYHKYEANPEEAAAAALKAGCDLFSGSIDGSIKGQYPLLDYKALGFALKRGLISEKEIDTAITRTLTVRFQLGLFDPPDMVPYSKISMADNNTPAARKLARQVADESIVLLKNYKGTLPLKKNLKSVAVIGAYANDIDVLLGNYHGIPAGPVTILQGIRNVLGKNVIVRFAEGYNPPEDIIYKTRKVSEEFISAAKGFTGKGFYAEYFDNPYLKGNPVLIRKDVYINYSWGFNSPGNGVPSRKFSARWTAVITPPISGNYRLGINTFQRGKLFLNGKLIVDNRHPYQINVFASKTVHLIKGKRYNIKIEYSDNGNFAGIRFRWKKVMPEPSEKSLINKAVNISRKSDAIIAVAGISPRLEGEHNGSIDIPGFLGGDRTKLTLPANEQKLLKALHETGKPLVLVLVGGSALAVNWEEKHLPAIIDAWYPGEEGGNAVADVIFGNYNPSGKLPVTFYKSIKQLPPFTDYSMKGRTYRYFKGKPLYPFGFGLSYTTFKYSNLKLSKTIVKPEDTLIVSVNVKNTGRMNGDEVVQLYVKSLTAKNIRAIKSLKGFDRVTIKRGDTKSILIQLPVSSLKVYNSNKNNYEVEPGKYKLQIGMSSSNIKLQKEITVE